MAKKPPTLKEMSLAALVLNVDHLSSMVEQGARKPESLTLLLAHPDDLLKTWLENVKNLREASHELAIRFAAPHEEE